MPPGQGRSTSTERGAKGGGLQAKKKHDAEQIFTLLERAKKRIEAQSATHLVIPKKWKRSGPHAAACKK